MMTVIKKLAEGLDPTGPDLMVYLNLSVGRHLEYVMGVFEPTDPDLWEKIRRVVGRWTSEWSEESFKHCVWYVVFV